MDKKFKKEFNKIADELFDINQRAIKENDEDAKSFSCYLIEIIDGRMCD